MPVPKEVSEQQETSTIRDALEKWSRVDVRMWVVEMGLGREVAARMTDVDGRKLVDLDEGLLQYKYGLTPTEAEKVMQALEKLMRTGGRSALMSAGVELLVQDEAASVSILSKRDTLGAPREAVNVPATCEHGGPTLCVFAQGPDIQEIKHAPHHGQLPNIHLPPPRPHMHLRVLPLLALPLLSLADPRRLGSRPARLAAANVKATSSDPCTTLQTITAADDVLACFNQFPINSTQREDQIASIKRFFEVYSFLELAKTAAPPLIPSNVDILALLDEIAADNSITTELAFHTRISTAIQSLNDPHAHYNPKCFSQPTYYQPWVISSGYDITTDSHIIALRDLVTSASTDFIIGCDGDNQKTCTALNNKVNAFWSVNATDKFNPADYIDWTVEAINGVDVLSFVQDLGDFWGQSKTPESRFNSVLASYQITDFGSDDAPNPGFAVTNGLLYVRQSPLLLRTDTTDGVATMTYSLVSPDGSTTAELNVPWVAFIDGATVKALQKGKDAYYSEFCPPPTAAAAEAADNEVKKVADAQARTPLRMGRKKKYYAKSRAAAPSPDIKHPLSAYSSGAFYNLDGNTGVWIFSSASPPPKLSSRAWAQSIIDGLDNLMKSGPKNLIIDVTSNGGGDICVGYDLAVYLLRTVDIDTPNYDFRLSDTSREILDGMPDAASIFTATGKASLTGANLTDAQLEVGGAPGRSDKFNLDCLQSEEFDFAGVVKNETGMWESIAIVSDGMCGSTCATFT
ncbi:hypothetical protein HK101_011709, partial [Irineochytrium annulatum]